MAGFLAQIPSCDHNSIWRRSCSDHLCEYCIRAFTVQSNMKRHMRVCKHKPLSPPMSLCYIISTAPSLTTSRSRTPFQGRSSSGVGFYVRVSNFRTSTLAAMQQIDRSSSLMLHGDGGPGSSSSTSTHPSILSASIRQTPMIETPSGSVPMISFEHSQYMDQSQVSHPHAESPPMVKGYKAPMIIAAMFSVQQNVPASVAKFTLVHLECEIPLPPITPHPEYVGLYPDANGFTAKIIEQPGTHAEKSLDSIRLTTSPQNRKENRSHTLNCRKQDIASPRLPLPPLPSLQLFIPSRPSPPLHRRRFHTAKITKTPFHWNILSTSACVPRVLHPSRIFASRNATRSIRAQGTPTILPSGIPSSCFLVRELSTCQRK